MFKDNIDEFDRGEDTAEYRYDQFAFAGFWFSSTLLLGQIEGEGNENRTCDQVQDDEPFDDAWARAYDAIVARYEVE